MKDLPLLEWKAPYTKSSIPPLPLIWRVPSDSAATWPYRSTSMALVIDTALSCRAMTCGWLV